MDLNAWLKVAAETIRSSSGLRLTKLVTLAASAGLWKRSSARSLRGRAEDIQRQWREAEAAALRKRVEELLLRHSGAPHHVHVECALEIAERLIDIERHHGPLAHIPDGAKRKIARRLERSANGTETSGVSHARLLLAAHIQAQTLPGEDAEFIHQGTERIRVLAMHYYERQSAQQAALIDHIMRPSR